MNYKMSKAVRHKTFKVWVVIEEITKYENGDEEYKDIDSSNKSVGAYLSLKDAEEKVDIIIDTFRKK
jgi:hypothetical protein